jgi:hypothetical protein
MGRFPKTREAWVYGADVNRRPGTRVVGGCKLARGIVWGQRRQKVQ